KAAADKRQERRGHWTMLLSLASVCVTVATLAATTLLQKRSIDTQTELKRYEVTFRPRQEAYTALVSSIGQVLANTFQQDQSHFAANLSRVYNQILTISIFLRSEVMIELLDQYSDFAKVSRDIVLRSDPPSDEERARLINFLSSLSLKLRTELFLDRDRDL